MSSSNITIMSYNTWSEDIFCEERLTNLITLIYYNNCDILCFQELTPYIFNKLIHRISLKYPYIISTPELENCKNYGTAIFSKYKIDEYFSNELFTNKQKYILLAKIKMKDIIYMNTLTLHPIQKYQKSIGKFMQKKLWMSSKSTQIPKS